jgi:MFS transporter, MHS family, alpha-ketoglutarate permease
MMAAADGMVVTVHGRGGHVLPSGAALYETEFAAQTVAEVFGEVIARPFGGFFFGRISDKLGRKRSLALIVGAAAFGSLLIAISPTYGVIGIGASIILVVARLIQGLAHGGEQPSAQAYLAEAAPPARRGLWSTLIYFSGTIGATLGILLAAILSALLSSHDLAAWGWRIPFAIGAIGGLFALYIRLRMKETEQFLEEIEIPQEKLHAPRPNLWHEIWTHRRAALQVIGMSVGITVAYYLWVVSASAYSIAVLKADPTEILVAGVLANLTFLVWLPLWGILSDRIGRKPVMYIGIVGLMVTAYPLTLLLDGNAVHLFIALAVGMFFLASPCAVSPAQMTELFPTRVASPSPTPSPWPSSAAPPRTFKPGWRRRSGPGRSPSTSCCWSSPSSRS